MSTRNRGVDGCASSFGDGPGGVIIGRDRMMERRTANVLLEALEALRRAAAVRQLRHAMTGSNPIGQGWIREGRQSSGWGGIFTHW